MISGELRSSCSITLASFCQKPKKQNLQFIILFYFLRRFSPRHKVCTRNALVVECALGGMNLFICLGFLAYQKVLHEFIGIYCSSGSIEWQINMCVTVAGEQHTGVRFFFYCGHD